MLHAARTCVVSIGMIGLLLCACDLAPAPPATAVPTVLPSPTSPPPTPRPTATHAPAVTATPRFPAFVWPAPVAENADCVEPAGDPAFALQEDAATKSLRQRGSTRAALAAQERGRQALTARHCGQAVVADTEVIRLVPDWAGGYVSLAADYQDLARYEDALLAYQAAELRMPDDPIIPYDQGIAFAHLNRLPEAVAAYTRAIDTAGSYFGAALINRANVYEIQGNSSSCIDDLNVVLAVQPANYLALTNRSFCELDASQYEKALSDADAALARRSTFSSALLARGSALVFLKRYQEARAPLEQAAPDRTNSPYFHDQLGKVFFYLPPPDQDIARAATNFSRAIELDPQWAVPYLDRAQLRFQLGQNAEALADATTAKTLQPDLWEASLLRAQLLHELKRDEEAAVDAQAVLTTSQDPDLRHVAQNLLYDLQLTPSPGTTP